MFKWVDDIDHKVTKKTDDYVDGVREKNTRRNVRWEYDDWEAQPDPDEPVEGPSRPLEPWEQPLDQLAPQPRVVELQEVAHRRVEPGNAAVRIERPVATASHVERCRPEEEREASPPAAPEAHAESEPPLTGASQSPRKLRPGAKMDARDYFLNVAPASDSPSAKPPRSAAPVSKGQPTPSTSPSSGPAVQTLVMSPRTAAVGGTGVRSAAASPSRLDSSSPPPAAGARKLGLSVGSLPALAPVGNAQALSSSGTVSAVSPRSLASSGTMSAVSPRPTGKLEGREGE
jgi:hypothetical protein